MGLTQALGTAAAGLQAAQTGLSIVGANVANAQTPGYTRKVVETQAIAAGGSLVSVRVSAVNRTLDQYLQRQLRTESSGGAYADLRTQFYSRLQDVYGDPESATSLETVYNTFTSAVQALASNPSDYGTRQNVLTSAQSLAQQLNSSTDQIQSLRQNAEQGLADSVQSVNDCLQGLAKVNVQLASATSKDASRASLLDQRDGYLDKLSTLMDIRINEDNNDSVTVFTSSGVQLVGTQAATMSFDQQGSIAPGSQWNSDPKKRGVGTITLTDTSGHSIDLISTRTFRSGKIAAYLEMRDQVLPQAQTQLDQLADSMSRALSDATTAGTGTAVAGAFAGPIGANGNLVLNINGTRQSVTLTAGQTLNQVVGTINAALGNGSASGLGLVNAVNEGGRLVLTAIDPATSFTVDATSSSNILADTALNQAQSGFGLDVSGLLAGNHVDLTYTDKTTGTKKTATIVRVDDPAALPLTDPISDPNHKLVGIDWSKGMASVISQLNAAFGSDLQFSSPASSTIRVLDTGPAGKTALGAASATRTITSLTTTTNEPQLPLFKDGSHFYTGMIDSGGSQSVGYAGRIAVNADLLKDQSKLVVFQAATPSADQTRAKFLYKQLTEAVSTYDPAAGVGSTTAPYSGTIGAFLQQAMTQQGSAATDAKNLSAGQDMVVSALQQRMDAAAAVNVDQEMTTLLTLQTAYGANARVFTVVNDMLQTLLKM